MHIMKVNGGGGGGQLPLIAIHGFTFMPQPLLPVSTEWEAE